MTTTGRAAETARAAFRACLGAPGHAVENGRAAAAGLEEALAAGTLTRTPGLDRMLRDLAVALDTGEAHGRDAGEKLGAKSAEAARFILRAISRELENA